MNNVPTNPIKMKLKYALKNKTKYHNEPVESVENLITQRRRGRT